MKQQRKESGLAALALCLAVAVVICLGGLALAGGFGRARIVSLNGTGSGSLAVQTSLTWDQGTDIEPTEIYELAAGQTVAVEAARSADDGEMHMYGAGFIITYDGYIMTNCHVVSDALAGDLPVQVRTFDGKVYPATIVGADQDTDIALLKVNGYFVPATLGNSDKLKPCQQVYIMGHPADELRFTMTAGIISAMDRTITFSDGTVLNMFQLDAAVNFGNSGGPVYNSRGEVIGITTAKYAGLYAEGLGFAIPINEALTIAEDLKESGFVRGRPLMGITVRTIGENELEEGKENPAGVYVHAVIEGLCGDEAGLRKGDIILSMDGVRVTSTEELANAKKPYRAGDTVTLEVWRDGETFTTELTFAEVTPEHPTGTVPIEEEEEPEEEPGEEPGEETPREEPED